MFVRSSIISGLFTNLSAASFGVVILAPGILPGKNLLDILAYAVRFIAMGSLFLMAAEGVERGGESNGNK